MCNVNLTWHIKWGVYICRISVYARYKYTYIVVNACWILIAMETRLFHVVHLKPYISWVVFKSEGFRGKCLDCFKSVHNVFIQMFWRLCRAFYVASVIALTCYVCKYFIKHADNVYGLIRLSFYKRTIWNIICVCLFTKAT